MMALHILPTGNLIHLYGLTTTHLGCVISLKYLPPIPISVF